MKKIIKYLLFICALFLSINHNYEVKAAEINEMGTFPNEITSVKGKIVKASFIKDSKENINAKYNEASIKADLTKGEGSVKAWLEVSSADSTKYELFVASSGTIYLTTGNSLFEDWKVLKEIKFDNINTSKVTNMMHMFDSCENLISLDLSNFDTKNVTNMQGMFNNCQKLTQLNLSNFNTSNVVNMQSMFGFSNDLTSLDLSSFDTSNVVNMHGMFAGSDKLTSLDLSNFNTSKVTDMNSMFYGCISLTSLNISNFDTKNVTDMNSMFASSYKLTSLDLSNFNTSKVTDMNSMFFGCGTLTSLDLSNFETEKVTNADNMFSTTSKLQKIYMTKKSIDKISTFNHGANISFSLPISEVNTLKTLILSKGTLNFNPNTISYNVTVDSTVSSIIISSTLTDEKSKYVEGYGNREINLEYGVNIIPVKVQAENGSIRTYTINILREINLNDVNTLKTLQLDKATIDFKPEINQYEITVEHNIDKIKITSTLMDEKSKYVEGFGNREVNLEYGINNVLVKVQSENNNVNTYVLVITRLEEDTEDEPSQEENSDNVNDQKDTKEKSNSKVLLVVGILTFALGATITGYALFKKNKK